MHIGSGNKINQIMLWGRLAARVAAAVILTAFIASCGSSPGYSYTVGGVVSGLAGSGLVLQNNLGDDLSISKNGSFSFPQAIADGGVYAVTIKSQPGSAGGLHQACYVVNGSGAIKGAVASVQVNCTQPPPRFAVDSAGTLAASATYNAVSGAFSIQSYTIAQGTGALAPVTTETAAAYPPAVAIADIGAVKKMYAVHVSADTVSTYTLAADGTLSGKTDTALPSGSHPVSVTVVPVGSSTYAFVPARDTQKIYVYSVDPATGALSGLAATADTGRNPSSLTIARIASSGVYAAYVRNAGDGTISAYTIDPATGAFSAQGTTATAGANTSIVVNAAGTHAYALSTGANTIYAYRVDAATGALSLSTTNSTPSNPIALLIDPSGQFAYTPNFRSNSISLFRIDGGSGTMTGDTAVATGTNPYSVTFDPDGKFLYAANYGSNNVSAYTINQTTGGLTAVAGSPFAAGTNPYAIVTRKIGTAGAYVYVAWVYHAGGEAYTYTIDPTTGALTKQ